jgi:hypothetical protein
LTSFLRRVLTARRHLLSLHRPCRNPEGRGGWATACSDVAPPCPRSVSSVSANLSVVLGRRVRSVSTMRRFGSRLGGRGRSAMASTVGIGDATPNLAGSNRTHRGRVLERGEVTGKRWRGMDGRRPEDSSEECRSSLVAKRVTRSKSVDGRGFDSRRLHQDTRRNQTLTSAILRGRHMGATSRREAEPIFLPECGRRPARSPDTASTSRSGANARDGPPAAGSRAADVLRRASPRQAAGLEIAPGTEPDPLTPPIDLASSSRMSSRERVWKFLPTFWPRGRPELPEPSPHEGRGGDPRPPNRRSGAGPSARL